MSGEYDIKRMLSAEELADELRLSLRSVRRLDSEAELPEPVTFGRAKRWTRASVEQWILAGCPPRDMGSDSRSEVQAR